MILCAVCGVACTAMILFFMCYYYNHRLFFMQYISALAYKRADAKHRTHKCGCAASLRRRRQSPELQNRVCDDAEAADNRAHQSSLNKAQHFGRCVC